MVSRKSESLQEINLQEYSREGYGNGLQQISGKCLRAGENNRYSADHTEGIFLDVLDIGARDAYISKRLTEYFSFSLMGRSVLKVFGR